MTEKTAIHLSALRSWAEGACPERIPGRLPQPPGAEGMTPRQRMLWKKQHWTFAQKAEHLLRMLDFVESPEWDDMEGEE